MIWKFFNNLAVGSPIFPRFFAQRSFRSHFRQRLGLGGTRTGCDDLHFSGLLVFAI